MNTHMHTHPEVTFYALRKTHSPQNSRPPHHLARRRPAGKGPGATQPPSGREPQSSLPKCISTPASQIYPLVSTNQHCSDSSHPPPAWRPTALSLPALPTPAPSVPGQTPSSQCQDPEARVTMVGALSPSQPTHQVLPTPLPGPSTALAPASLRAFACIKPCAAY